MIEHHRPLGLQVLIELHTVPCTRKQLPQRCLAPFERLASQIVAIEFDDVECPHEHARIVAPVSDPVEQRDAIMRIPTKSPGHSEMMSPGVPTPVIKIDTS